MKLEGTVALVTGGTKRVGRAIVQQLAEAGCDVAIHCRDSRPEAESLADLVKESGRRAIVVTGDLNHAALWPCIVADTVSALGRLDVLVNNASMFLTDQPDTLEAFDVTRTEVMFRVNVTAPLALCHHAMPHLKRGRGVIINLCDATSDRPHPNHLCYGISKEALASLTRALARVAAPEVRVIGVAPGIAVFPEAYSQAQRQRLLRAVPLHRGGSEEEVARLVTLLVERADYVTGQVIRIDGGRSTV